MENVDKRFAMLEDRLNQLQEPIDTVDHHNRRLKHCEEVLAAKADLKELADAKEVMARTINDSFQQLHREKASLCNRRDECSTVSQATVGVVSSLEESQVRFASGSDSIA